MKKELILLESEYLEDGEDFEAILQNAIEVFLRNFATSDGYIEGNIVKYT